MTQPKDPQEFIVFKKDIGDGKGLALKTHLATSDLNLDFYSKNKEHLVWTISKELYEALQSKLEKAEEENEKLKVALQKAVSAGEFFCRHADCTKDTWACKCEFCRDTESSKNLREARQALKGEEK